MKKIIEKILLLIFVTMLTSCGVKVKVGEIDPWGEMSNNIKKESDKVDEQSYLRQKEPAFDISGLYNLSLEENPNSSDVTLELKNEGMFGKLYGKIERSDFSIGEKALFSRMQIPLESMERFRQGFTIDKGNHSSSEDKENTSIENGKRAKVFLRASSDEVIYIKKYTMRYSLIATLDRSTNVLKGTLFLRVGYYDNSEGYSVLKNETVVLQFNN